MENNPCVIQIFSPQDLGDLKQPLQALLKCQKDHGSSRSTNSGNWSAMDMNSPSSSHSLTISPRSDYGRYKPPLTWIIAPLTYFESLPQRKEATPAISSGVPILFCGTNSILSALFGHCHRLKCPYLQSGAIMFTLFLSCPRFVIKSEPRQIMPLYLRNNQHHEESP